MNSFLLQKIILIMNSFLLQKIIILYNNNMKLKDFNYNLPEELIAQSWVEPRDHSRLLLLDKKSGKTENKYFYNILDELWDNDILVLNKTKVINARLHWKIKKWKKTQNSEENTENLFKNVEIFLHKQITNNTWNCRVYPGKNFKIWKKIELKFWLEAIVKEINLEWRVLEFNIWWIEFLKIIEKLWEIPLPPYIKEKLKDDSRYQTIWAETEGSVAAPTASLHFTDELLEKLEKKWVKIEKVLLHIWLGTFMPILTENILEHQMHSEYLEVEEQTAKNLNKYKSENKRIIAVWTTAIRVLESMTWEDWIIKAWKKETDIFIYPGYKWKFVDAIITNFHLPESTLLMLVSSFAWKENIEKSYKIAVENKYRFFSFGDSMFIK